MNWFAVSDVASLVGKNKYEPASEMIEKYRQRYFPDDKHNEPIPDFQSLCDVGRVDTKPYFEKLTPVVNSNAIVKALVDTLTQAGNINVVESVEPMEVKENLTITMKKSQIKKIVKSEIYKQHGLKTESFVEEWVNENIGTLRNQQKGAGVNLMTLNGIRWRVFGKVDGILTDSFGLDSVVEIKNRQNKLFRFVPEYERVQCQLYMYIFKIHSCKLVEHFKNQYKVHTLQYDEEYVLDVLETLKDIVKMY
jgi:hypothetical protein